MAQVTRRTRWTEVTVFWSMVLASFGLVFAVAVLPDCRRSMATEQKVAELSRSNRQLAVSVEQLEAEREALEKDAYYVEKTARRVLNMHRPGETVFVGIGGDYASEGTRSPLPASGARNAFCEMLDHLAPFATNGTVRVSALILALVNLLAAFLLFGKVERSAAVRQI